MAGLRTRTAALGWLWVVAVCALGGQAAPPATGTPADGALNMPVAVSTDGTGPLTTLHVYTNLRQVPVLVLTAGHNRMKAVPESQFRIRLDGGTPFRPTHVRREGDDPIALAVMIEDVRSSNSLLAGMEEALEGLVPNSIEPHDTLSIYVRSCGLVRTSYNIPADRIEWRDAMERALKAAKERVSPSHPEGCKTVMPLWDSLALVTQQLGHLPGRRVILTLTQGKDHGSKIHWEQLKEMAQAKSISVFGLMAPEDVHSPSAFERNPLLLGEDDTVTSSEDLFDTLCELTGGVEFESRLSGLPKALERFTEMLRERYIVEFPRGNSEAAGQHSIEVMIGVNDAFVRPAGISVPLADAKVLADPTTIPSDPGASNVMGKRKGLVPPS